MYLHYEHFSDIIRYRDCKTLLFLFSSNSISNISLLNRFLLRKQYLTSNSEKPCLPGQRKAQLCCISKAFWIQHCNTLLDGFQQTNHLDIEHQSILDQIQLHHWHSYQNEENHCRCFTALLTLNSVTACSFLHSAKNRAT
jgi:hypothetical protein